MGRNTAVLLFVALALLATPAFAAAATLHTTPNAADGATCSASSPCDLATAFEQSADGDTIVIGTGTYSGEGFYNDNCKDLTIVGAAIGDGRPVIAGGITLEGDDSSISDVELNSEDGGATLGIFGSGSAD